MTPSDDDTMPDLFGPQPAGAYPYAPGAKSPDSWVSARRIARHARTVWGRALAQYMAAYPAGLTADEVAARIGESQFTTRPRVAELHAAGLIERTIDTRVNASSRHAARVWRATRQAMEMVR
jgi:hypothetical protein